MTSSKTKYQFMDSYSCLAMRLCSISYLQVYFANVHPKFPSGGKMSQHLESLEVRVPAIKLALNFLKAIIYIHIIIHTYNVVTKVIDYVEGTLHNYIF